MFISPEPERPSRDPRVQGRGHVRMQVDEGVVGPGTSPYIPHQVVSPWVGVEGFGQRVNVVTSTGVPHHLLSRKCPLSPRRMLVRNPVRRGGHPSEGSEGQFSRGRGEV